MQNIIDEEGMRQSIEKINLYKREEEVNFEEIVDIYNNALYYYNTSNHDKLESFEIELSNKFRTICMLHKEHLAYLEKIIASYHEVSQQVKSKFEDII